MTKRPFEKRVLLLAAHLPDGGINTHMLTLGIQLKKLGWDVAICSGGSLRGRAATEPAAGDDRDTFPPRPGHYERAGIAHFDVSIPDRPHRLRDLPRLLTFPLAMWQVIRAARQFRPAVMHSHTRQMGVYARAVQFLLGVPFVSSMHNPYPPTSRLFAKTTLFGSVAVGDSGEIRDILVGDYGVDPDRARVVVPGVDTERFHPPTPVERRLAQERFGVRPDQFVIAFIASLRTRKRPDTFIEAVADIGEGHDVAALVAGHGPDEEAVQELASRLQASERIQFIGYQDSRDVLWAADALVLPSQSEGSPLVVVEAMLSGVVVMVTPAGGTLQQITPDVSGVLFPYGDHEELARRIVELIERPVLRKAMTARALEDARDRYSSMRMAQTIEAIYMEVVKGRG